MVAFSSPLTLYSMLATPRETLNLCVCYTLQLVAGAADGRAAETMARLMHNTCWKTLILLLVFVSAAPALT